MAPSASGRPEIVTPGLPPGRQPWIERLLSGDHKSVALMQIGTAGLFGVIAAVGWVLMRVQLIVPESTILAPEIFNRLLSVQAATVVILFALPLALGLITYVVPLQLGSRLVALPRIGQLGYWLYLLGGVTLYASFLYRPPEAGPLSLPPLSDELFLGNAGVDAWIVGVGLAVLGMVLSAINIATTIRNMRAPGMALRRMPPFAWAGATIANVLLVVGPVLLVALAMLFIDRNFEGVFYDPGVGGAPLLYQHLAWIFFSGAYGMVLVFAFGALGDIVPTFARRPLSGRPAVAASLVAIGVLAPLAWLQNMYGAPIAIGFEYFGMAVALSLTVPIGVILFNLVATAWGGTLEMRAPLTFALGAASTMAFGLAAELALSSVPVGWQLGNSTAAEAATAYVMIGGGVLGGLAALHYWLPKISGRRCGEAVAAISLWLVLGGVHLFAIPLFLAGLEGQALELWQYEEGRNLAAYNLIASIGAFACATGIVAALANLAYAYANGSRTGHDPWGGSTLEWFALSPPPPHNFDVVPDVRSAEPMHEIREAVARRAATHRPAAAGTPPRPASGAADVEHTDGDEPGRTPVA